MKAKAFFTGLGFGAIMIVACGAMPTYKEPPSWTLSADGRLRASQRGENFTFADWKHKYLDREGATKGAVLTPAGVKVVTDELARRGAKIVELENKIRNGCR